MTTPRKLSAARLPCLALMAAGSMMAASDAQSAEQARARVFKFTCYLAKTVADDPIVFPNQPGASHLHDFYGNKGVDADTASTEDLLRFASNCGAGDRSAYWTPSLFRDGVRVEPDSVKVYYENRSFAAGPLQTFPSGFRMVMGNPMAKSEKDTARHWTWACEDGTGFGDQPPERCKTPYLQLRSEFPNCWDGTLPANGDATRHMAWARGLGPAGQGLPMVPDAANNSCPATHPVALPMLRIVIKYRTGVETGRLSFASSPDRCSAPATDDAAARPSALATKSGSVYAKHGDFFNGWNPTTLKTMIDRCLNDDKAACEERKKASRLPFLPLAGAGVQYGGFPEWVARHVAQAARSVQRLAGGEHPAQTLAARDPAR